MQRIVLFLIILILLTDCKKLLHEEKISIGRITSYEQLVNAVGGVYGSMVNNFKDNGFYDANIKGDDINLGESDYYWYYYTKTGSYDANQYTPLNNSVVWESMYQTIASANNIINQYKPVLSQNTQTQQILGEIYMIRAYCYYRLTRTYGQVPIIDNIDISYNNIKASFIDIYKFIETDLKIAKEILPKNNNNARVAYVTPHRGTAKAILAEVYLSWAGYPIKDITKYTEAVKESGEVIDSAAYFGFNLLNDFAWLWDKTHFLNQESVFSIYFPNPSNSRLVYFYYNLNVNIASYSGGYGFGDHYITPNLNITTYYFPVEVNFFNNYPEGYRKEITFYSTIYIPSYFQNTAIDTGYIHINKVNVNSRVGYRKFYYEPYEEDYTANYKYNGKVDSVLYHLFIGSPRIYLFRYASTMLTYAEAMARSSQPDVKAYDCINQIRRRAHHLDLNASSIYDIQTGLSSEAFADSVVWERAWELCGEPEGRWFDLIRLEMVEDLPKLRNPIEGLTTFWGLR